MIAKISIIQDKASEDSRSRKLSKKVLQLEDEVKLIQDIENKYIANIADTKKHTYYYEIKSEIWLYSHFS